MEVTTAEAADILGVTDAEVRRLLRGHVLVGRRVGSMWLIDAAELHRRRTVHPRAGRAWGAPVAWAAVLLLAGRTDTGLSASETSRLRRSLRAGDSARVVRQARQLMMTQRWRVPASGLEWLSAQEGVAVAGASVAQQLDSELSTSGRSSSASAPVELVVAAADVDRLRYRSRARLADESANAVVQVVAAAQPLQVADVDVQNVLTALLLATHSDARLRAAGSSFLGERLARMAVEKRP